MVLRSYEKKMKTKLGNMSTVVLGLSVAKRISVLPSKNIAVTDVSDHGLFCSVSSRQDQQSCQYSPAFSRSLTAQERVIFSPSLMDSYTVNYKGPFSWITARV